jgi:hypothetical protein
MNYTPAAQLEFTGKRGGSHESRIYRSVRHVILTLGRRAGVGNCRSNPPTTGTTQIFLAVSARYDELLQTSSAGFWMSRVAEADLPEPTDELTISLLRYCAHVSFSYFRFKRRRIPTKTWKLMLPSVERTIRSPLFVREWQIVESGFESFPDFVALVTSIQERNASRPLEPRA